MEKSNTVLSVLKTLARKKKDACSEDNVKDLLLLYYHYIVTILS